MTLFDELEKIAQDALARLSEVNDSGALEAWYADTLGRKGAITLQTRAVGQLPKEDRPVFGQRANELKQSLETAYAVRAETVKQMELAREMAAGAIDVTLPGRPLAPGHLHLTTQSLRQLYAIFALMGFEVYEAPDVELEVYNFDLLNIPEYHPARDMWDTFWVKGAEGDAERLLLRTHTSPGQIRVMKERSVASPDGPLPIRVVLPGKCYRYEQITARAEHQFYQLEGLAVGHTITLTDLVGTVTQFARLFYGPNRQMRVRSSYFPFTEPSIEVDTTCTLCNGKGCRICKNTGWIEIAGAGMVQPVVLQNGGYDPDEWSGFAFGFGVERPSLTKYNVNDIRLFYGNDLRFLRQF
ncbi:MAG: phenylalanine--tRNA ligase subunit alpha [Anaerolineae bacterium]|nr:phenylalanine--tRNA ligase subunit alpha [Anaerolineae bacterium]